MSEPYVIISADAQAKRLKMSMKQLEATPADEFAKDTAAGDLVTGRVIGVRGNQIRVQLGEGVEGVCTLPETAESPAAAPVSSGSLAAQLAAVWKGGARPPQSTGGADSYRAGELRSFTIKSIDASGRKIELNPA